MEGGKDFKNIEIIKNVEKERRILTSSLISAESAENWFTVSRLEKGP